jgi:2-succinyl-5-enolpyruvyl-6-hydroxy-3-cyclohexene-1-carboxylate synthase
LSLFQTNINAIVSGLYAHGITDVVISPGSRNAPIIMAFVRHPHFQCWSVPDERSAGFIALGMAKAQQKPVVLLCTSGSALVNYYPAIVEAYYMQVPLIVISADRPEKMLDRWDGQTIHQFDIFNRHVYGSYQTPENLDVNQFSKIFEITDQLYLQCNEAIKGPVHLNVPLREPLYEAAKTVFEYPDYKVVKKAEVDEVEWEIGIDSEHFFQDFPKVMVLLGANDPTEAYSELKEMVDYRFALVIADVISNAHAYGTFKNIELYLLSATEGQKKMLAPDLLITTGQMIISKPLKQLLRSNPPKQHWHIAENGYCADPFFSEPQVLQMNPLDFFKQFKKYLPQVPSKYVSEISNNVEQLKGKIKWSQFGELSAITEVLNALPEKIGLHLSNSMTIRNVSFLGEYIKEHWCVYGNRGVSGIDGCTSTAVGMAIAHPHLLQVLITGDVAFFYDINAFWHSYSIPNFKVVLMNNSGGGIFDIIDGPSQLPELNPYIKTPHQFNAKDIANHYKLNYFCANDNNSLKDALTAFLQSETCSILEIQTDSMINQSIIKNIKSIQYE